MMWSVSSTAEIQLLISLNFIFFTENVTIKTKINLYLYNLSAFLSFLPRMLRYYDTIHIK